jgi:hypothetical protein
MTKKPQKPAKLENDDVDQRTEAETAKVRDQTLKRMLTTKPQPHKTSKGAGGKI